VEELPRVEETQDGKAMVSTRNRTPRFDVLREENTLLAGDTGSRYFLVYADMVGNHYVLKSHSVNGAPAELWLAQMDSDWDKESNPFLGLVDVVTRGTLGDHVLYTWKGPHPR